MDDAVAKKTAVAWKIYRPTFKEPSAKAGEDEHTMIARFWEGVGPIDFDRLANIAGLPVTKVTKAFARLRAANLIWPDGSMSDEARKIIVGEINVHLMPMIPKVTASKDDKGKTDERKRSHDTDQKAPRKNGGADSRAKARSRPA